MDFTLTNDQQHIRDAVLKLGAQFPDNCRLALDRDAQFPVEFHQTAAGADWLGVDCGIEANAAKYLKAEAGYEAGQTAVMSMVVWVMRRNIMSNDISAKL